MTGNAFLGTRLGEAPPAINLVLPEFRSDSIYAGVATALTVGVGLSRRLGVALHVISLDPTQGDTDVSEATRYLEGEYPDARPSMLTVRDVQEASFNPSDIWIATYWTTAHALAVASAEGLLSSERVIYLIQDYEPGFAPWSTDFAVARATYHSGFLPLVNSVPVADYLSQAENIDVPSDLVFAPALPLDRLQEALDHRDRNTKTTVLFYGRPSKPRNMYQLGVAALRESVRVLGEDRQQLRFVSAGQQHDPIDLGFGMKLHSVGKLDWDEYFDFLPSVDVLLSLQMSPHPSHPPLEAALAGAQVVTNTFFGTRDQIHPRIATAKETPEALGAAICSAVRSARSETPAPWLEITPNALGRGLDAALDSAAERFYRD